MLTPWASVGAYAVVLLLALAEALPVVGVFVPGQTFLLAAAALAATGQLSLLGVLGAAAAGAIAGDAIAFGMGRAGGPVLLERYGERMGLDASRVDSLARLLARRPILAIVGGRFNHLTRAIAPFAAGALRMCPRSFVALNVAGGILWSVAFGLAGYLLGSTVRALEGIVGPIVLLASALVTVGLVAAAWLRRRDPALARIDAGLFVAGLSSLGIFALLAEEVEDSHGLARIDGQIAASLAQHAGSLAGASGLLGFVGSFVVVAPLVALAIFALWRRGEPREAFRLGAVALLTLGAYSLLKLLYARPRPPGAAALASGYSFPSGHAAMAAALMTYAAWLALARLRGRRVAGLLALLASAWALLIGISRMTLGVHYLTDVLAGLCLGFGIAALGATASRVLPVLQREAARRWATRHEAS